jgi:hypothetical protein
MDVIDNWLQAENYYVLKIITAERDFNKSLSFLLDYLQKELNKTVKYMRVKFPYEIRTGNPLFKDLISNC